jgi:hypothetical protein
VCVRASTYHLQYRYGDGQDFVNRYAAQSNADDAAVVVAINAYGGSPPPTQIEEGVAFDPPPKYRVTGYRSSISASTSGGGEASEAQGGLVPLEGKTVLAVLWQRGEDSHPVDMSEGNIPHRAQKNLLFAKAVGNVISASAARLPHDSFLWLFPTCMHGVLSVCANEPGCFLRFFRT